jgi:nitroreductase
MDVAEAVAQRRSIRTFQEGGVVTDAEIAKILEAGRLAPSWKNDQPWRFVVVRSEESRNAVADCLPEGNPATKAIRGASALIIMLGVPAEGEVHQDKPFWLVDCGIAGENMYLQAVELGVATVWASLVDGPAICRLLEAPEGMECVGVFPLGRPQPGSWVRPRPRKELAGIAFFERYGQQLVLT